MSSDDTDDEPDVHCTKQDDDIRGICLRSTVLWACSCICLWALQCPVMIQMTSLKCIALKRMMTFEAFVWGWLSFKLVVTFACEHCSVQWWYRWRVSITMYIQNMGIQFQIWNFLRCFLFAFAVCTCDLCAINDCSHLCTSVHMWFSLCILTAWCRETRTLQTSCGEVVLDSAYQSWLLLLAAVITDHLLFILS